MRLQMSDRYRLFFDNLPLKIKSFCCMMILRYEKEFHELEFGELSYDIEKAYLLKSTHFCKYAFIIFRPFQKVQLGSET